MQATATEMIPAVGQLVGVRMEEMTITCRVMDVKMSWGKARFQVRPLQGVGMQWVEGSRLSGATEGEIRAYTATH